MERDELLEFLVEIQDAFYQRDLEFLLKRFSLPLVIYSAAGVTLVRDKAELERLTDDYRAALNAMSATHGTLTIRDQEQIMNNRLRVTIRAEDLDANDKPVTGALVRYFLFKDDTSYVVEMLEYLEAPIPIEQIEDIVH